ncbi:MAG: amino acid adenylation domain-containing protein, partial [bacterium]|nr:amino acid adenylation domain-containing protein [bacterium]
SRLYRESTVQRIVRHFTAVLDAVLSDVNVALEDIEMLSEAEKEEILVGFNHTAFKEGFEEVDFPHTLHQVFERQVAASPDAVSIVHDNFHITYGELNRQADNLARVLRRKGVSPDDIVALRVEPSIGMMIGELGILKAGGAYLPLPLDAPVERIRFMLEDSSAKILVSKLSKLSELSKLSKGIEVVNPDELSKESPTHLTHLTHLTQPTHLGYVIYTSGTTGQPKGVLVEHRNVVSYLRAFYNEFEIRSGDTVIQLASYAFDVFIEEVYSVLLKGGKILIPNEEELLDVEELVGLIRKHQVNIIDCTPLLLNEFNKREPHNFKSVHTIISGADVLKEEYIGNLSGVGTVYNTYGPTESTVCAAYYKYTRNIDDTAPLRTSIPIGRPIAGYSVYILSGDRQPVPIGVAGEICISGAGVTRGYLNRPELTAEKFPAARGPSFSTPLYSTGDLARWLPDGPAAQGPCIIEFLGRIDQQVKIRGYRIETGEIEHLLVKREEIKDAVVFPREDKEGEKYLCAYIVAAAGESEDITGEIAAGLRDYLMEWLPDYMVPSFFVPLERIPLTANGKIDRKALPEPAVSSRAVYAAPQNKVEEGLVEIWQEVLDISPIGVNDNFFELGGHSLRGLQIINSIHKMFNVRVPLEEIFRTNTIRGLGVYIKNAVEDEYAAIEPAEKKEYYALSSAQKRLYVLQQMEPAGVAYNMPRVIPLAMAVDREQPAQMFEQLSRRHESLRTSFLMAKEEPVQKIHNEAAIEVEYYVAHNGEQEDIVRRFVRPFDLSRVPLLRVGLIKIAEEKYVFLTDMHHIISDGVSSTILVTEFLSIYAGTPLPPLRLQYKDFAEWQNSNRESNALKQQEVYWVNRFENEIQLLDLPLDYARPKVRSFDGDVENFTIAEGETKALEALAKDMDITLYILILAIYNILLFKLSGREDIVVGSPTAGRGHEDLQNIIGMFVNTLALRNYPSGEKSIKDFIDEVKQSTLEALENQEYQFEDLVEKVSVVRDVARNPIFDVLFTLQNIGEGQAVDLEPAETVEAPSDDYGAGIAKFDMTLFAAETADSIDFSVQYCTKLFKKTTIRRFIGYFKNILSTVTGNPSQPISGIEIMTEAEKKQILVDFNDTASSYPREKTIHQLFEEQVERTPYAVALTHMTHRSYMSYDLLNRKSNHLADFLMEKGVIAGDIVAIMPERSLEMIIGILGILKAGGAYLPIDAEYPRERIDYTLKDSNAKVLLSELSELSEVSREQQASPTQLTQHTHPTQLSYIIYTSGSTGKPKGVMVEHRNVVRLVKNTNYIEFRENERLLQTGALEFDASTFEIWGSLLNGMMLCITAKDDILNSGTLKQSIVRHDIGIMWLTAPLFNRLCGQDAGIFAGLRTLLVGGDVLSPMHINMVRERFPMLNIINGYGPTENTTFSTTHLIGGEYTENIPIGRPIANSTTYIVDRFDRPVPVGVPGELLVGGDGVARGYLNNPELTADAFVAMDKEQASRRGTFPTSSTPLYKTGDLARWFPPAGGASKGTIEFLGRIDSQVKIRGFRIELGEIEAQLLKHPSIKEAVVIDRMEESGEKYLCAYFVSTVPVEQVEYSELKKHLSTKLPGYMIPSYFVPMEEIPLTPNGKVDRKALPVPGFRSAAADAAPADAIEERLVALWSEILNIEKEAIGVDADFFQLGGHSLKATILTARIHKILAVKISLTDIFRLPTIRELGRHIRESAPEKYADITKAEAKEYYSLSSAQKRLYILQQMDPLSTAYNMPQVIPLAGEVDKEGMEEVFNQLIRRHESLRTSFIMVNEEPAQRIHEHVEFKIDDIIGSPRRGVGTE